MVKYFNLFLFAFITIHSYCWGQFAPDTNVLKTYFQSIHTINIDSAQHLTFYQTFYHWKNVKYRMAGNSENGIDCSHFSAVMYKNAYGKILSGSAADYYNTIDIKFTNKNDLQEGDLVFFTIKQRRVSHVGVYLQNNKFAHATVSAGVIISDLNEPYYKKYYHAAGRYKNLSALSDSSLFLISSSTPIANPLIEQEQPSVSKKKKNNNKFRHKRKTKKSRSNRKKSKKKTKVIIKYTPFKKKKK